jgi:hypothetical protein
VVSKVWNWLKSFFVKVEPVVVKLAPSAVIIAEAADPKLTPFLAGATNVVNAIKDEKK